jgi:hypothetical protein
MKLRIKGNSMRLRVSPSEVTRLLKTGRIEETIYFVPEGDAKLTYALELGPAAAGIRLRYQANEVAMVIPANDAKAWAEGEQEGIYGAAGGGERRLELAIEKDFACLDKGEEENRDTFPHPMQGSVC